MKTKFKLKMSVFQLLSIGYLVVILLGSGLLSLPFATVEGESTTYLNALFTSTSAVCVTGLVPYDTGSHWSLFGQIIILILIQTGGLGFMTIVSILFSLFGRDMGLYSKKALMQSAGGERRSEIKRLVSRIFRGTALFEGVGALLLMTRFIPDFGPVKGIYYSIWHSISAFCNAGFDLMGGEGAEKFVSFTRYAADPVVVLTLCFLIMIGGIGFCVWSDVIDCKFNLKNCRLHTKVAITVNAVLIVLSTILFYLFERNTALMSAYNEGEKILIAFFNAVTPRTAGFNTIDYSAVSNSSYLLTVMLMFMGGSSGSTAGGVKVNTIAVIFVGMIAVFRDKKDVEIGKRRIDSSLVYQALAVFVSYLFIIMIATLIICVIEPDDSVTFTAVLFETVSALGTVGLSLSLTPILSAGAKIVIILLMYTGRVGIITLALSFARKRETSNIRRPLDTMLIG